MRGNVRQRHKINNIDIEFREGLGFGHHTYGGPRRTLAPGALGDARGRSGTLGDARDGSGWPGMGGMAREELMNSLVLSENSSHFH